MPEFQETAAKKTVRELLRESCEQLRRRNLTYLGLPGELATDLRLLGPYLENAICVERDPNAIEEIRRNASFLPLKKKKIIRANMWDYLRDQYSGEALVADVTFLDFYGGGLSRKDPFADEIGALRSYFMKQARYPNRAFVFGWTYMPRDQGEQNYVKALEKINVDNHLLKKVTQSSGTWLRSIAVRLLLRQSLYEHDMLVKLVQHTVYKSVMNAVILVYSKGRDSQCNYELQSPDCLLTDPVWIYERGSPTPKPATLPLG
jgi:hypothetical protein